MSLATLQSDITKLQVEATVNAANSSLLGGGADCAIHRAAESDLVHACRLLGGCMVGEAKLAKGSRLPPKLIVNTLRLRWRGGGCGEAAS
ncbi:MAG: macro domain-containing protein [Casimicrobium sp.]